MWISKGQNEWNMICLFYHHWSGDRKMSNCINLICIELSWALFPLDFDWIVPFGKCWKREKAFSFLYGTVQVDLWNSTCEITGLRKVMNCILICFMFYFRSERFFAYSVWNTFPTRLNARTHVSYYFYWAWSNIF